MSISITTLALAKKYADSIAIAGSKEALDKAIKQAVDQSKLYTDTALSNLTSFNVKIVESLPLFDIDDHTIYFVKKEVPSGEVDYYYEYIFVNGRWELIGSTQLDLSAYWTSEQVKEYIDNKEYSLPRATATTLGGVKVDGTSIGISADGTIFVTESYAKDKTKEVVQDVIDENFSSISTNEISNLFN